MHAQESYEYINDFLYFVIRRDMSRGKDIYLYCSGVNIDRFHPVTSGRHGIGSNPALRGLQLVNHGVRALALSKGATPKRVRGNDCAGIAPTRDNWYTEVLGIENAPGSLPGEVIDYAVLNLLKKIFKACMLELQLPDTLPKAGELQELLEGICGKYSV